MSAVLPVQASAQAQAGADCTMEITGVIARRPRVAMRPLDDLHFVPVLVLELQDCGAGHHSVVAHVPYSNEQRELAEADARRYRAGQRVTVATHLVDVRLLLPAASVVSPTTTTNP